jgi:hypothetical protein
MNNAAADCSELTLRTSEALDNEALELLFAIVQQNSIQVSLKAALRL